MSQADGKCKFSSGDVVRLKSGGPEMTVAGQAFNGQVIGPSWFDAGELRHGQVDSDDMLEASSE